MHWSRRLLGRSVARWLDLGASRRERSRPVLPRLEELERREMMSASPFLVADVNPGSAGSFPAHYTNVNGTAFFSAPDGTHGEELFRSNATSSGTTLVADVNPGSTGSYPGGLTNVNGTLFFTANDG